jgi:bifunctional non-homologous end joining protein LigD
MGLKEYKHKRNFKETSEPEGETHHGKRDLKFVVQKHDASHLHYDFRLEMEGVLKSWAVPKGPSMNPEIKRLAMMVEDHPYDYRTFEGIIPQGNYGGGTVMVWDEGTYHAPDTESRKESEKKLLEGLKDGHFHFILDGKKLKGEFMLFRFPKGGDNAWLLAKHEDEFATEEDITEDDLSAKTGRSLEEIEKKVKKHKA